MATPLSARSFLTPLPLQAVADSIVFQMMVGGAGCVGTCNTWFDVLFADANNMLLNLTGSVFSFMQQTAGVNS